jgi:predicted 3-demethylubiquinone-9 3-methyltransferase (glyoxalase superfamily)
MTAKFQIEGQEFMALNGGPAFKFSPAISFFVNCETQEEVDELWEKLSAGGEMMQCGWLKDKFGVTWQIIAKALVVGRQGSAEMAESNAGDEENDQDRCGGAETGLRGKE